MTDIARESADDRIVLALVSGKSVRETAQECGISEATVFRRLGDVLFLRRLSDARSALWADAYARLSSSGLKAVQTLSALLDSGSDSTRLNSAKAIIDYGVKLQAAIDFDSRLAALECKQCANSPGD